MFDGPLFTLLFVSIVILAFAVDAAYERRQRAARWRIVRHDGTDQAHPMTQVERIEHSLTAMGRQMRRHIHDQPRIVRMAHRAGR